MRAKTIFQEEACILRRRGYSYAEISEKIGVSKSSVSIWCRDVVLTPNHKARLQKTALEGAEKGRKKVGGHAPNAKERIFRSNCY